MTPTCSTIVSSPLGSNCHVIVAPAGRFIIDTGHPRAAAETLAALEQQGHLADVAAVLHTHSHADHVGASALLHERTGAQILSLPPLTNGKLSQEQRELQLAPEPFAVSRVLSDGEAIDLGDDTLRVVATPGHADDHLAFFLEKQRILFAGDLFSHGDVGTLDVTHHHAASVERMLASLGTCAELDAAVVKPGHGPAFRGSSRVFRQVEKRIQLLRDHPTILVAHTLMPLLLLLIDSRRGMDVADVRDYALSHAHFFENFLDHVDADVLTQELGKILLVLEMKGAITRDGSRVTLRTTAPA
jgi:glyoxylase-like metal-dependent hydrolase (beta-lactamase superfamily II)